MRVGVAAGVPGVEPPPLGVVVGRGVDGGVPGVASLPVGLGVGDDDGELGCVGPVELPGPPGPAEPPGWVGPVDPLGTPSRIGVIVTLPSVSCVAAVADTAMAESMTYEPPPPPAPLSGPTRGGGPSPVGRPT